ncbi:flagellar hook capping FlgD N-terminal domain-containing protein [Rhodoferax sp. OV413]|uniref:flagellar hook assembly protein FlgD n=1 Tax=Rhodoferax sp. OV413 TaxID=1855285 RepID=UPI0025E5CB29|nr:flagellar hook capping FlgD N-terminal domain-containing protein [Rhodoferax sp. OV413]
MTTAVSALSSATTPQAAGSSTAGTTSAKEQTDRFMKLLVAQLNNQDPMNPMDNAQMTSQIAQINTVSGIQELNATMQSMSAQFTSMQVLQATSMVGRGVMVESNALAVDGGIAKGAVHLQYPADKVTVEIATPGGQVLGTVDLGQLTAGQKNFEWDASKYPGLKSANFTVKASQGGQAVSTTTWAQDTVTAVGLNNGSMSLQLKGRSAIGYGDVKSIL